MTDPRDRLLDHALREVLNESSEAGADLSRAVREAWERGERRPAPKLVKSSDPVDRGVDPTPSSAAEERMRGGRPARRSHTRGEPRRGPVPLPMLAAAATVLLLGGVWALMSDRGEVVDPGPATVGGTDGGTKGGTTGGTAPDVLLARADRALRVSGSDAATDSIEVGRAAFVPDGAPASIALPADARLEADPGTVFTFQGRDALALGYGSVRIAAGDDPIALEVPGQARIDVPRGSAALVALRTDLEPQAGDDPAEWLASSMHVANGVLDVRVERGEVALTRGDEPPVQIAPEQEPEFYLLARGTIRPATEYELGIGDELKILAEEAIRPNLRMEMLRNSYREGSFAALREAPEVWPLAEGTVAKLLDPEVLPAYARTEILTTLSVDPSPFAYRAVRDAWLEDPSIFATDAIVAMAERGAFEFEREVDAWFTHWDEDAEGDPVPIALLLATRGDARGDRFLRDELTVEGKTERIGLPVIAAAALTRTGDPRVWDEVVPEYAAAVREAVAADDVELASVMVDALAFAIALRDDAPLEGAEDAPVWERTPRVGAVWHWVDRYHRRRDAEPRDAAALEAELARLESR